MWQSHGRLVGSFRLVGCHIFWFFKTLGRLFLFCFFQKETTPPPPFKSASERRQMSATSCQPIRPFRPLRRPFPQQLRPPVRRVERRRLRSYSFHPASWHWPTVKSTQGDLSFLTTVENRQQKNNKNTKCFSLENERGKKQINKNNRWAYRLICVSCETNNHFTNT